MGIITFITSLFNIGLVSFSEMITTACLYIDGMIYQLLSYTFKLFNMVCQLNFNQLEGLIAPLIDRAKALIVVIILYKVGVSLINYLLEPEKASQDGQKIVTNILIAACLLVSYQTIFGIMNELCMLIVGTSGTYQFTYLDSIAGVTEAEDNGLINRFIFGNSMQDTDAGEFVAFEVLSVFVDDGGSGDLEKTLGTNPISFKKLTNIMPYIDKTVEYTSIISALVGVYLIYVIGKSSVEVGIRMFKLLVIQLIAPIAIMSIITDGTKGEKFKSFVSTYIKTFTEVFIRIASILIMTVLISKFLLNIRDFLGSSTGEVTGITKGLLIVIICIAGFKFAQEAPKFIEELLKVKMGETKGGFGSFLGNVVAGGVGAAAGYATGLASGIKNGDGFWGSVANANAGMLSGAANGIKGNTIKDKIANMKDTSKANTARAQGIYGAGGVGNYIAGSLANTFGGARDSQDREMARYDKQAEAIKAYDEAQKEAISDTKMITGEGTDAVNVLTADEQSHYSDGYGNVKFGTDKASYVNQMMEYDTEYQNAKIAYDRATNSRNANAANTLARQRELLAARENAKSRAGTIYDRNKNSASSAQVNRTRTDLEASGANIARDDNDNINIKQTKANITESKRELASSDRYKRAHNVGGKK